jgi:hypothetical protein
MADFNTKYSTCCAANEQAQIRCIHFKRRIFNEENEKLLAEKHMFCEYKEENGDCSRPDEKTEKILTFISKKNKELFIRKSSIIFWLWDDGHLILYLSTDSQIKLSDKDQKKFNYLKKEMGI